MLRMCMLTNSKILRFSFFHPILFLMFCHSFVVLQVSVNGISFISSNVTITAKDCTEVCIHARPILCNIAHNYMACPHHEKSDLKQISEFH